MFSKENSIAISCYKKYAVYTNGCWIPKLDYFHTYGLSLRDVLCRDFVIALYSLFYKFYVEVVEQYPLLKHSLEIYVQYFGRIKTEGGVEFYTSNICDPGVDLVDMSIASLHREYCDYWFQRLHCIYMVTHNDFTLEFDKRTLLDLKACRLNSISRVLLAEKSYTTGLCYLGDDGFLRAYAIVPFDMINWFVYTALTEIALGVHGNYILKGEQHPHLREAVVDFLRSRRPPEPLIRDTFLKNTNVTSDEFSIIREKILPLFFQYSRRKWYFTYEPFEPDPYINFGSLFDRVAECGPQTFLICGLPNAGHSTLLKELNIGIVVTTLPVWGSLRSVAKIPKNCWSGFYGRCC